MASGRPDRSFREMDRKNNDTDTKAFLQPEGFGENNALAREFDLGMLTDYLDWASLFRRWGWEGRFPDIIFQDDEADRQYQECLERLGELIAGREFHGAFVVRFFNCHSTDGKIILEDGSALPTPPVALPDRESSRLCDFIAPEGYGNSIVGLYALKVEDRMPGQAQDSLRTMLRAMLAPAMREWIRHEFALGSNLEAPEIGSPWLPDPDLGQTVLDLLDAGTLINLKATGSGPGGTSLCGLLVTLPETQDSSRT